MSGDSETAWKLTGKINLALANVKAILFTLCYALFISNNPRYLMP